MARRSVRLAVALVALGLGCAAIARADVVDGTAPSCPDGAIPRMDHTVGYCAPGPRCTSDAACTGDMRCEETRFCLGTAPCGGDAEPDCHHESVEAVCGAADVCPHGACERARRCVPPPPSRSWMTCAAGAGRTGSSAAAMALALAVLGARRRVSRRPSSPPPRRAR